MSVDEKVKESLSSTKFEHDDLSIILDDILWLDRTF